MTDATNAPATTAQTLQLALSVVTSVAATLGPIGATVSALVAAAGSVISLAQKEGRDVTDAEVEALFTDYAAAQREDDAATAAAKASGRS